MAKWREIAIPLDEPQEGWRGKAIALDEPPAPSRMDLSLDGQRITPAEAMKRAAEAFGVAAETGISLGMASEIYNPPPAVPELPSFLAQLAQAPYHFARRVAGGILETGQMVEAGAAKTVSDFLAQSIESPKARIMRVGAVGPNLLEQAGVLSPEMASWIREKALPLLAGNLPQGSTPTLGAQVDVASKMLRNVGRTREADILEKVQERATEKVRSTANAITENYVKYLLGGGILNWSIEQTKPYLSETPAESVKAVFTNPQLLAERVGAMVPYMAGTVALAIATRGMAAPFIMTYLVEGEGARQAMPEDASPAQKGDIAQIVGFINGAVEMWQASKIIEFVGGKTAQRAFSKKVTEAAVKNLTASAAKSVWAKGASVGLDAIKLAANEGGQEVIQQATQEIATSGITGEPLEPGFWERLVLAGGVAAIASVLTGGLFKMGERAGGVKAQGVAPQAAPAPVAAPAAVAAPIVAPIQPSPPAAAPAEAAPAPAGAEGEIARPTVAPAPEVAPEAKPGALPEPFAEAPPKHTVLGDFHAEETGAFRAKGAEEVVEATESALRQTFKQAQGLWRGIVDLPGNILKAIPAENPIGKIRDWVGPRISVAFGRPQEWVEAYFQAQGSTELAKLRVAKIAADMTSAFKKAGLDPNDAQTMMRIEAAVRGEVPMESLPPVGQEWAKTIRAAQDTESLYAAEIFDQVGLPEKAKLYRENVGKYLKHVPMEQVSMTAKAKAFIGRLVGPRLSAAWGKRAKTRWDVYVGQKIVASFDPATDPQAEVKARAAYQEAVENAKIELATKRWQAKKWTLTRTGKVPVTKTVLVDGKPVRKFAGEFTEWMKTVEGAGPEAADLYRKAAGRVHLVEPISAQWRLEHEVHDPRYLLARGAIEARHDAEMARLFSVAAERWGQEAPADMTEEEVAAWAEDGGLVQLPESGRLHDLKGMYVPKNIALDLTDMVRAPSMLSKLYQQYLGVWKESKTVWNPATHGRNVIGNVGVFSYLARCSPLNPLNAKYYVQATQELWNKGEAYEDLVRFGAVGTEYYGAELHRLNDIVRVQTEGRLDTLMALQRAARDNVGALYALEDQWFKTAAFLKYRSEGMSAQVAAEEVNKWFPNYARIGKMTRILRQSPIGAPFLSFVDQSIRIGARAARDRPLRLLALVALPGIASYLSALALGLSDEEKELIDKQRGYFEPLMPFRGKRDQAMTLDLRYIMPLANDIAPEFRGDLFILPWFLQSPMLRAGIEQTVNKDLFLGRPIVTEKMTAKEKLLARLGKIALTAAPYPTGTVYGPGRIGRAMDEDGRETLGLAILGTLSGVNIRPAYVSEHDVRETVKNAWIEGEPELAETLLRLWNDRYRPADKDRLVYASIALGAISEWPRARTLALQEAAAMLIKGDEGDAKERIEVYNTTVLPEIQKKSPEAKELNIAAARRLVPSIKAKRAYKPIEPAANP